VGGVGPVGQVPVPLPVQTAWTGWTPGCAVPWHIVVAGRLSVLPRSKSSSTALVPRSYLTLTGCPLPTLDDSVCAIQVYMTNGNVCHLSCIRNNGCLRRRMQKPRTGFSSCWRAHVVNFVQVDMAFAHMRKVAGAHSALGPDHTASDMLVTAFLDEAIICMYCNGERGLPLG
jgi:hypothetical protein